MKIIDLHCDTLYKFYENENYSICENNGHITDKALKEGGYFAQCFAIYIPGNLYAEAAYGFYKKQYKLFKEITAKSNFLKVAKNLNSAEKSGKVSALLTVENAHLLNGDISRIAHLETNGVRILGLIHNNENCLGYSHSLDKKLAALPLKPFGREVVEALNNTNITVDVSHLNYGGFCDVSALSKKPFVATHSACRSLKEHSRNLYDDQIRAIASSGGVVGVPFYALFLKDDSNETKIADIIRHLEHIIKIGGEDTPAFGTDFDGMNCSLFLENCSAMQILVEEIIKKFGFNLAEKICYKNAFRIL